MTRLKDMAAFLLILLPTGMFSANAEQSEPRKPIIVTQDQSMAAFIPSGNYCDTVVDVEIFVNRPEYEAPNTSGPSSIARLSNNLTNLIKRQCQKMEAIQFVAYQKDYIVFRAVASKETGWVIHEPELTLYDSGFVKLSPRDQVSSTVLRLFEAINEKDVLAINAILADGSSAFELATNSGRRTAYAAMSDTDFVENLFWLGKDDIVPSYSDLKITVNRDIASVWMDYDVQIDGRPEICGKAVLTLYKSDRYWNVTGATYTSNYNTACNIKERL